MAPGLMTEKRLTALIREREDMHGMIAALIEKTAALDAQIDAFAMDINEQETGLRQAPRPVAYWRERVIESLPISQ